jgi:hypothetical protein
MRSPEAVGLPVSRVSDALRGSALAPNFPRMIEFSSDVTVTAHATPHTVGAWQEVIASSSAQANLMVVAISGMSVTSTDTRGLVDIGFGAAAAEQAVVSSLPAGFSHAISASGGSLGSGNPHLIWLPVNVPKGTRISARLQALITVDTAVVTVSLFSAAYGRSPAKLDTLGATTASSEGTSLGTSYTEITAATAQPYQALILLPCGGTATVYGNQTVTYTLGVGAAAAEVDLATTKISTDTAERIITYCAIPMPTIVAGHFPKGIRVAAKQSLSGSYRGAIVLGVPYS